MAKFVSRHTFARWTGGVDQLRRAAEIAEREVARWPNANPTCVVDEIYVASLRKRSVSLDDLTGLGENELDDVKSIAITVGAYPIEVEIYANDGTEDAWRGPKPGLHIDVEGHDETAVRGLAQQMLEVVRQGGRRLSTKSVVVRTAAVGLVVTTVLLAVIWLSGVTSQRMASVAAVSVAATALGAAAAGYLCPPLEILVPGGKHRLARFGVIVVLLVAGIPGSLIAGILLGVLQG